MRLTALLVCVALAATTQVRATPGFSEDFDTYAAGSQLHGQGNWTGWDGTAATGALVSSAISASSPHSVAISGDTDVVHEVSGASSGRWAISVDIYIPQGWSSLEPHAPPGLTR